MKKSFYYTKLLLHNIGEHTMEQVTSVSDELVSKIRQDRDDNFCVGNFEKYIYRFGLEGNLNLINLLR